VPKEKEKRQVEIHSAPYEPIYDKKPEPSPK